MRSQVPVRVSLRTAVVSLAMAFIVAAPDAQTPEAQAEATNTKLQAVIEHAGAPRAARRTIFMDGELNAYLKYRATWLPEGITNAAVTFVSDSRVATSLIADLDRVRRKSSGGWFDPTAYLKGRLPVTVVGTLTTSSGRGTFVLETATVDGIPVPAVFIQELFAYYTRSEAQPAGVRLDEPFVLPSDIERIDVRTGQATVVQ